MLSYRIDGPILTIVGSKYSLAEERQKVLDAARYDRLVPERALLVIDVRDTEVELSDEAMRRRVLALIERLGPKMGRACAVVATPGHASWARALQWIGQELHVHIAVFLDDATARHWLRNYS